MGAHNLLYLTILSLYPSKQSNSLTVIMTMSSNVWSVPSVPKSAFRPVELRAMTTESRLDRLDTTSIAAQDHGKTHDLFKM